VRDELSDERLRQILTDTRSVAVVGASARPARPSYGVVRYLLDDTDYDVYLVNPTIDEAHGLPVYPSLAALPTRPDMVDVFRRSSELGGVYEEASAVGADTLWLQLGLSDAGIATRGAAAGMAVVMDRCLLVEHARLLGRN
jgi:predicted CoA-binding protein